MKKNNSSPQTITPVGTFSGKSDGVQGIALLPAFLSGLKFGLSLLMIFTLLMINLPAPRAVVAQQSANITETEDIDVVPESPNCTATTTNFANATPVTISTVGTPVVTSTITVAGAGTYLWDIDLQTFLTHTFSSDIQMTIQSPAGTVVTLTTNNGSSFDNVFNGTVWDDDADPGAFPIPVAPDTIGNNANSAPDHPYANAVVATPLAPEEALAAFRGENPNGVWTLTIADNFASDGGTLNSWNMNVTSFQTAPVETTNSFSNSTPVVIADTGNPTVTSTINVSGLSNVITKTTLQTFITHTFSQDLIVQIQSPAGTSVTLASNPVNEVTNIGNLDDVYNGTVWDDDANSTGQVPYASNTGLATDHPYANNVVATPLAPTEALGAFMGENPNGTWTLTIADRFDGDGGALNSWSLNITTGVCPSADLSVTKTDSPDPVAAGSNLTYTITAANAGPTGADSVTLSDTLPAGTTFVSLTQNTGPAFSCTTPAVGGTGTINCSLATFANAASASFSLVVKVDATTAAGTVLTNTATVSSTTIDSNPGNNSATATTTVNTSADLSVTKTDSPDPVAAGSNLSYTITVANAGPSNAAAATLSDTLPANTTFVSLSSPAGWSCTTPAVGAVGTINCSNASLAPGVNSVFTLVVAISAGTMNGTTITNTATVSSATSDPVPGNNTATTTSTVNVSADLSVTKTANSASVTAGTNLSYTLTVNNAGPGDAATVTLTDALTGGNTFVSFVQNTGPAFACTAPAVGSSGTISCTRASLLAGATATFTLTVKSSSSAVSSLSNTATISAVTSDPNTSNNSATATTPVSTLADLSLLNFGPTTASSGGNIIYSIRVDNNGPSAAAMVQMLSQIPAGTTYQSVSFPQGWKCKAPAVGARGNVKCTRNSFDAGTNATFSIRVKVNNPTPTGTRIYGTATVSSDTTDPNNGNNSAVVTTTIN